MRRSCWLVGTVLLWACARTSVTETALTGNLTALQQEVAEAQRKGELDRSAVEELAWAVAGRELRAAKGDRAVEKIRTLRPCASPLVRLLEDRASGADDAAAEATLILFELGQRNAQTLVDKYGEASSGAWRAVAARACTRPTDGLVRRKLFLDTDQRVRRAALHAAIAARTPSDLDALLETARLDPDPVSRAAALRAIGAIGGQRAAIALKDLWPRADESTRVSLVDAWAMDAAFRSGGRQRLVRIAENERGIAAINAAAALARRGGAPADLGRLVLARAIQEGSSTERRLAIQLTEGHSPDVAKALEEAAKSEDREVRVLALAKLLGLHPDQKKFIRDLRGLAKKDDGIAVEARAALSAVGDFSVEKPLARQTKAAKARWRTAAAVSLLRLGRYSLAATALADDDPVVRTAVACSILESRRKR